MLSVTNEVICIVPTLAKHGAFNPSGFDVVDSGKFLASEITLNVTVKKQYQG